MGCQGALNGLRVARSFVESDPEAVVLLCAVELCSLHFAYGWDPEMLVPNALFGDGAAAVVGTGSARGADPWRMADSGTCLFPNTADDMTWRIGDHGFRMTLSARIPDLIEECVGGWLESWLGGHGLTPSDIASWAVHPGGPRILGSVERAIGLDKHQTRVSREILAGHGNMSSATVLFILDRLQEANAPKPCVALAFGPGLVAEAALFV
jgi:predicted naringenin-chalcone synthase